MTSRLSDRVSRVQATWILVVGLCVSAFIGLLAQQRTGLVADLDNLFLDVFLQYSASQAPAKKTVVVDVDDISLSAVGQWPWPRYRIGALIDALARRKPVAIGVDILFPEPDRSSLINIQQTLKHDFGVDLSFGGVPNDLLDNDGYLGQVMSETGAVGSKFFYFDHVNKGDDPRARGAFQFDGRTDLLLLNDASGVLGNTEPIASQTEVTGFTNSQPDNDGALRRLPLLIKYRGAIHASLALATVMRSMGLSSATIASDDNGPLILLGTHRVPIDAAGFASLRFNGSSQRYPAISAVDILNGNVDDSEIEGKIVVIGSSATGLHDVQLTSFDPQFSGVKIQAVMAESIVTDSYVRRPAWGPTAIFLECIGAGALMSALFVVASGASLALLGALLLAAGLAAFAVLQFTVEALFVSPAAPMLVTSVLFVLFSVARFAMEKRRAYLWFKQLENARQVIIESMASVAETRDPETGAHIKRTQHYVKAVAKQLRRLGQHAQLLTDDYIHLLYVSAPLHDIGKVGVPDYILLKPGKLTAEEFELMKEHAEFGRKIICNTAQRIEGDNFLYVAAEIAATHHEKWDGSGYPRGLAGEDIPLSGRIMAVADIYDALISRRCYKEPFVHEAAIVFMRASRGQIFDPGVLDAFFEIEAEIKQIAARYKDGAEGTTEKVTTALVREGA
jgi:HD-GYP domain-containing protein (c-di-GMP phosphodiesterase class II)/CHASE2 domain-containing sensor protein